MIRRALFALATVAACAAVTGCVGSAFSGPVAISTKTHSYRKLQRLGPVREERCDAIYTIVPVSADTKDVYDALLAKAEAAGGNAVIDFQQTGTRFVMVYPLYVRACWEVTGTAVIVE